MKRIVLRVAGLVFLAVFATASGAAVTLKPPGREAGETGDAAEQAYRRAIGFLADGELAKARQAFREALDADPQMAKAMLGLAEVAFKKGDLDAARSWIASAVRAAPDDPHVLYSRARLAYLDKDYVKTEWFLNKVLSIDPGYTQARISLGDLYLDAFKDPSRAVKAYRRALKDDPDHAGAHYALGVALLRLGKLREGERELEKAARLQPDNPLPMVMLGREFLARDPAKAVEYFSRALEIDPRNKRFLLLRAEAWERQGKFRQAARDYEAVTKIDPGEVNAHVRLGMIRQGLGDRKGAREAYLRALKTDRENVVSYNNLAWMAAEEGEDLDQALRWANEARRLAPKAFFTWDTLGWVYRARKDYAKAAVVLEKARKLAPYNAQVNYHLGVVYAESGQVDRAMPLLEKVSVLAPGSEAARKAKKLLKEVKKGNSTGR